ncbi:hypothetical protein NPIL_608601 [Nephila pilipes]|uniref:Uncharacterized protein n=1 Tax=Nephila pilipes TaxID=299642 RepID=A0A8X6J0U3_NEPPI|nr:hypothetical protein NPIL_608601 [Nephila pilipes]
MQNVRRQLNVTTKLPERGKPEDADKVTMNGDAYADDLQDVVWRTSRIYCVVRRAEFCGRRSRPTSATCKTPVEVDKSDRQLPDGHETEETKKEKDRLILFSDALL